ncbi:MAG: alpha/beta hydrolase [Brevundimonas sp.]|uniref:alpha/beta hydrolase family protein n=1 Tax=Brevundimonas sp. TaxID=1871086 RepID=UPI0027326EC0|nr:alpha/beta hydrolase [Brevundimonas sp.]MDP3406543.1 alpha/beta hydrolase [Brevundimonas sp.]
MRLTGLLACALLFGTAGAVAAQSAPAPVVAPVGDLTLAAPDGRSIPVFVWPAADERAVILFSHGLGGAPAAYDEILTRWSEAGFTVIAPMHLDSRRHPEGGNVSGGRAFMARIGELAVTRAMVKATHPGKPLLVAGHSFGSLMSLIQAGAVSAVGPMGDPDVKAVIAISSAGDLQGLVTADTWTGVAAPLLMVTGDADTVPGFVTDWTAHRSPFDRSPPGDRMLVIFEGGDHNLVAQGDEADRALLATVSLDFMRAHGLGDAAAADRLQALSPPTGVRIERR